MYVTKEIEIDLDEFYTEDLIEELEERGVGLPKKALVATIWNKRRLGQDYQADLDKLIYEVLGKIL